MSTLSKYEYFYSDPDSKSNNTYKTYNSKFKKYKNKFYEDVCYECMERWGQTLDDYNNCNNCKNCDKCIACNDCIYCNRCYVCYKCTNTIGIYCKNCKNCGKCDKCNNCEECIGCYNCNDCNICTNCNDCCKCTNCKNCKYCYGLTKKTKISGIMFVDDVYYTVTDRGYRYVIDCINKDEHYNYNSTDPMNILLKERCVIVKNNELPKKIIIRDGSAAIVKNEFKNSYITKITTLESNNPTVLSLPKNMREINDNAFENCTNLRSVILPNSIEYIGDNAFKNCTNLQSIKIPKSINYISKNAFENCINLKSIVINTDSIIKNIPNTIKLIAIPSNLIDEYYNKLSNTTIIIY